jgi:hypothetical protein
MTDRMVADGWGNRVGTPWSEEEISRLIRLRQVSDNWDWIAQHFPGRTLMACQSKYHYHFAPRRTQAKSDIPKVTCATLTWPQERLRVASLARPYRTDITGIVCGDPAPGRSALETCRDDDRRRISLVPLACLRGEEAAP